jgi:hypothetical protein
MKALPSFLRRALACVALAVCSPSAFAQINLELKMARRSFFFDEPTQASLIISNSSGRELLFEDTPAKPWVEIFVKSAQGRDIPARSSVQKNQSLLVAPNEVARHTLDINALADFPSPGKYSVSARVTFPDSNRVFVTNNLRFDIESGTERWTRTVGLPADPSGLKTRTFSVFHFLRPEGLFLYARLEAKEEGTLIGTYPLGRMSSGFDPQIELDQGNNLYVFHLAGDDTYALSQINIDGSGFGQAPYSPIKKSKPRLVRQPSGGLAIQGAARDERAPRTLSAMNDEPKISDRPSALKNRFSK